MKNIKKRKIVTYKFHDMDFALVLVTLVLSLFGIVMAFSASYYSSISQNGSPYSLLKTNIIYYAAGWLILLFFSRLDYHYLKNLAIPAMLLGLILLILLLVLRDTPYTQTLNNATRWLDFGVTVMPGELIKPALILFFAAVFSSNENCMKNGRTLAISFGLIVLIAALIYLQPNLSTACIVIILGVVMMYIAGLRFIYIGAAIALGVALVAYLYFIDDGYMHTRIVTAIDPWADPLGDGYQVVQSLLAFGSGGVFGRGLGQSIQKTLYLPEPQSDFILPIIGEEIGFVGILALLVLYAILIGRIISVALRSRDRFGAYLAAGTGALISIHVILNIMVVTATFPPTGVFLPFMSQGGNATWVFLALIGITLNVSRQARKIPEEIEL